jgi:two-component system sensor kinase FixL
VNHVINVFDLASLLCMSREKEEVYPALYDKAPSFIALSDGMNHEFTYANAAYKSFVKRDGLIGQTVVEALPEVAEQGIIAILDEVYQTGKPFRASDMPISIWNADLGCTEERWIDVVYQPVRDENGAVTGLFCSGYDVTELRAANSEIAALQMEMAHVSQVNAMGTMAATLAHELNQPLTAISNYLGGVRPQEGQAADVGRLTEALERIREASKRAADIIDHVRELTKHRQPSLSPFSLKGAVDECIRLVGSSSGGHIAFKNSIAPDLIMTADVVKIHQVLINLLQNACDAVADGPHAVVSIDALQDDHHLTVCVADTGPGVSPKAVATMFAWSESSKGDGMGIGLSICRTIIELHRGSIWLEQTGPQGSEFRFSVPVPVPVPAL